MKPKWHDAVPSELHILQIADRATKEGDAYRINKFRYSAQSHRNALLSLAGMRLLKRVRGENPLMYFEITEKGRQRITELKEKAK